jgi:hypothetical protein
MLRNKKQAGSLSHFPQILMRVSIVSFVETRGHLIFGERGAISQLPFPNEATEENFHRRCEWHGQ